MSFKSLLVNVVLASLFIVAIIALGSQISLDNETNISILDNDALNDVYVSLNDSIVDSQATGAGAWEVSRGDTPTEQTDLTLTTIAKTAFSLPNVAWTMFKTMFTLLSEALNIPPVVTYALSFILLVIIISVGVSLIKAGI